MNCKLCNTRTNVDGVCPHCGWSRGGVPLADDRQSNTAAQAEVEQEALAEEEVAIELVEVASEQRPRPPSPASSGETTSAPRAAGELPRIEAAELASLLAKEPELLEPGLLVYRDDDGRSVGAGYGTEVGAIDLLARDPAGAIVLVVFAESLPSLIDGVLQRIGWAREHLATRGEEVRAIVLAQAIDPKLRYAASGLGNAVSFKSWRLVLRVEDVEL